MCKDKNTKKEVERYKTHMKLECLFLVFTIEKKYRQTLSEEELMTGIRDGKQ